MGNNTYQHPLTNLNYDKPINLQKLIPKREWWTVWYYIFTGKMIDLKKENNN
jgi:hypothetical protein